MGMQLLSLPRRLHDALPLSGPQLIDGANGINGRIELNTRIEILTYMRQEIGAGLVLGGGRGRGGQPRVFEGGMCGQTLGGIDGQAAVDEVAGGLGDGSPVFDGGEGVVGVEDGLHFFEVGVAVKGGVTA